MIGGMEAGTRRTVARLRFLEGASCAMIAWRLHYSRSYAYKALGRAWRRWPSMRDKTGVGLDSPAGAGYDLRSPPHLKKRR